MKNVTNQEQTFKRIESQIDLNYVDDWLEEQSKEITGIFNARFSDNKKPQPPAPDAEISSCINSELWEAITDRSSSTAGQETHLSPNTEISACANLALNVLHSPDAGSVFFAMGSILLSLGLIKTREQSLPSLIIENIMKIFKGSFYASP